MRETFVKDANSKLSSMMRNVPVVKDDSRPTTDIGPLELREQYDSYGLRLVALYRLDGGKRMSNWVRA